MEKTTKIALEAAEAAGKLLNRLILKPPRVKVKEPGVPGDIVTAADLQAEKLIKQMISRRFPGHAILSEETGNKTDHDKHRHLWVVDPLDGSNAFSAGLPFYSVSIAYFFDREPLASALYLGLTRELLWAETGKGAYCGRRRLRVRDRAWSDCVIALDPGIRLRQINLTRLAPALAQGIKALVMMPGEAGPLGLLARGNLQGLVCSWPDVWDYAAGIHLVREAGGLVTDYLGKPYPWFSRSGHVAAAKTALPYILKQTRKVAHLL